MLVQYVFQYYLSEWTFIEGPLTRTKNSMFEFGWSQKSNPLLIPVYDKNGASAIEATWRDHDAAGANIKWSTTTVTKSSKEDVSNVLAI